MRRFVEGADRGQTTLFPERLEDWIGEDKAQCRRVRAYGRDYKQGKNGRR
jgi:hypothetical protein